MGNVTFAFGGGKSKVLGMVTVRRRGWYPASYSLAGLVSLQPKGRETEQLFQRMFQK